MPRARDGDEEMVLRRRIEDGSAQSAGALESYPHLNRDSTFQSLIYWNLGELEYEARRYMNEPGKARSCYDEVLESPAISDEERQAAEGGKASIDSPPARRWYWPFGRR